MRYRTFGKEIGFLVLCLLLGGLGAVITVPFPNAVATVTQTVTSTQTTTNGCFGNCPTGNPGASTLTINPAVNAVWFTAEQNPSVLTATMYNVTSNIGAVNINAATGTLYLALYAQTTPGIVGPTSSIPLYLIWSSPFTVINGSTSVGVSFLVPNTVTVCGYCWFAVALMSTTTHSNSAANTGSGVKIRECISGCGSWFSYQSTSSSVPYFLISTSSGPNPAFYEYVLFSYKVTAYTTTSTVSTSASVTVTSTVSSTSEINGTTPTQAAYWYFPLFFLLMLAVPFAVIGVYIRR